MNSEVKEKTQKLIAMTGGFCDKHLDDDYKQLCEKLVRKMARKRNVPFLYGQIEIWAAAILYTLGRINFLFDKSSKPHSTTDDICNHFGVSKKTVSQKSKAIRDLLKLSYWDEDFSTADTKKSDPFSNLVMIGEIIVDKRHLEEILLRRMKNPEE